MGTFDQNTKNIHVSEFTSKVNRNNEREEEIGKPLLSVFNPVSYRYLTEVHLPAYRRMLDDPDCPKRNTANIRFNGNRVTMTIYISAKLQPLLASAGHIAGFGYTHEKKVLTIKLPLETVDLSLGIQYRVKLESFFRQKFSDCKIQSAMVFS